MAQDNRITMNTGTGEEVELLNGDEMTDQERKALQREIADADRREKMRRQPAM